MVHNLGPSVAENVEVVDTHVSHDAAFTIDGVTPPVVGPNGCSIAGGVVTCNFATMLVGTDQKIEVTIAENNPRDINDTVSVSSDMFDSDLNNNIAADGLHIVGSANVSMTKSDAPDPVNAGQDLTYTLTIANAGPSTAVGVVVNDAVPAGTSMVSAVASQGSCTPGVPGDAAQPTVCTLGNIVSGNNVTVTIVVHVLPGTTGLLHNTATASSETYDPDNANNSAAADTTVNAVTGLSVTKWDDKDPVIAGSELKYTVEIANAGPSTATDVGPDAARAAGDPEIPDDTAVGCPRPPGLEVDADRGPRLGGQWVTYLKTALRFVPTGEHLVPPAMESTVIDLSPQDIDALMHYYTSQQAGQQE